MTVPAVLAAAAVVAMLLGPCVCLPQAATAADHSCCTPPAGYRALEAGCCPQQGETAGAASALSPAGVTTPDLPPVASVAPPPSARPSAAEPLRTPPAASPPLTVRRL
jgi:hypothetical protein